VTTFDKLYFCIYFYIFKIVHLVSMYLYWKLCM